ncbi:enoyl-CoA delta isomerase 2, peroxisomal-like protein [Tanacetum coccineum]
MPATTALDESINAVGGHTAQANQPSPLAHGTGSGAMASRAMEYGTKCDAKKLFADVSAFFDFGTKPLAREYPALLHRLCIDPPPHLTPVVNLLITSAYVEKVNKTLFISIDHVHFRETQQHIHTDPNKPNRPLSQPNSHLPHPITSLRSQVTSHSSPVLVTVAEGKFFSNGFDLAWAKKNSGGAGAESVNLLRHMVNLFKDLVADLVNFPMPTIAVVTRTS